MKQGEQGSNALTGLHTVFASSKDILFVKEAARCSQGGKILGIRRESLLTPVSPSSGRCDRQERRNSATTMYTTQWLATTLDISVL